MKFDPQQWEASQARADLVLRGIDPRDQPPVDKENEYGAPPPELEPPPHERVPTSAGNDHAETETPAVSVPLITPLDWPPDEPPPVSWFAHGLIPRGDVTLFSGDGGLGKTMAALLASIAATRGAPDWLGTIIEPGPVVFLSAEEPEDEMRRRCARIAARQQFNLSELKDLHFWFPQDVGNVTLATPGIGGVMQPTPLFRSIEKAVLDVRPVLVVLDNVAAAFAGNQNDRVMARTFVNRWRSLGRASGAAIMLLDHPSLSGITSGTGRGGNMDWRNAVRSALLLRPADDRAEADRGIRILECVKNNYAPLGTPKRLEWVEGVLAVEGTMSPIRRAARDAEAEQKFLDLLDIRNSQARDVSDKFSRIYAPTIFAAMEQSGGYTREAFAKAMERLFQAGKIVLERVGPPSDKKQRIVRAHQVMAEAAE